MTNKVPEHVRASFQHINTYLAIQFRDAVQEEDPDKAETMLALGNELDELHIKIVGHSLSRRNETLADETLDRPVT